MSIETKQFKAYQMCMHLIAKLTEEKDEMQRLVLIGLLLEYIKQLKP